ncbi:tol-pal system-associated acyl-CoA thioesterase [Candidatus Halobeggiatoa sp. HSG11]|nr:tol-pal system-associated acyl-CoA thioesterase [Candidatus Halobeggiatoa sp. HSG11]
MNKFVWPVRVYHEDTDGGGVVYYANYLKFMERARTELLRFYGIEQTLLKQEYNIIFVVRQLTVEYLKPAFFNDLLNVVADTTKQGKVSLTMEHQILRDDEILCSGDVKIASINSITYRPQPLPATVINQMRTKCKS